MAEGRSPFTMTGDANTVPTTMKATNAAMPQDIEASQVAHNNVNHAKRPKGNLESFRNIREKAAAIEQQIEREAYENSQDTVVYSPEIVAPVPAQQKVVQPTPQVTVEPDPVVEEKEEEKMFDMDDIFNNKEEVTEEEPVDELDDDEPGEVDDDDLEEEVEPVDTTVSAFVEDPTPVVEEKKTVEPVKEDNSVYDENAVTIEVTSTTIDDKDDEDDDLEQEVQTDNAADSEKLIISLQRQVTEKLRPILHKRDLTGFTVATTPIGSNGIVETKEVSVAKWPLSATGITVQARTLLGSDLEDLRTLMQQNDARGTLQKIYDAIVSPKPAFNIWTKSIAYSDYDDLFMVLYIAAFKGSNYMPVDCANEKCPEKTYITDDIPFGKMVKYKDEASKEKFQKLYKTLPAENYGLTPTEVVPVAENYAIGFVIPSLYAMLLEREYFDSEFARKYATAIAVAPYIDRIYKIDYEAKKFVPIMHKVYDNNESKTAKSRIILINKILRTFNADEINSLKAYMEAIQKQDKYIDYIMPATTCPHCGKENAESVTRASSLLFLRNQLAALVNTSKS